MVDETPPQGGEESLAAARRREGKFEKAILKQPMIVSTSPCV